MNLQQNNKNNKNNDIETWNLNSTDQQTNPIISPDGSTGALLARVARCGRAAPLDALLSAGLGAAHAALGDSQRSLLVQAIAAGASESQLERLRDAGLAHDAARVEPAWGDDYASGLIYFYFYFFINFVYLSSFFFLLLVLLLFFIL